MKEFLARFSFWSILLVAYLVGAGISKLAGMDIDLKTLLPLLCLVFLDYWLRLFSGAMCSVKRQEAVMYPDRLLLRFGVQYRGTNVVGFGIRSVEGMDATNVELLEATDESMKKPKPLVPEELHKSLGPTAPSFAFSLTFWFRRGPVPILVVPFVRVSILRIKIRYMIDNSVRGKKYYVFLNRKGKVVK